MKLQELFLQGTDLLVGEVKAVGPEAVPAVVCQPLEVVVGDLDEDGDLIRLRQSVSTTINGGRHCTILTCPIQQSDCIIHVTL